MSRRNSSITPNRHNFEVLLERAHQIGQIEVNNLYHFDVFHDDDCSIYHDRLCDCQCVIRIEEITGWISSYAH